MINYNRLTYFFLLLFFTLTSGFAQKAPGYLGKRNIISYRGLIGPGFQPSGPKIERASDGAVLDPSGEYAVRGLFYENQVSYERVMSRKFSLRTSLTQQSFHFGTSLPLNSYGSFDYTRLESYIPGNAVGIEIAARWYYKHFAPLGWYFELHAGYQRVSYDEASFETRLNSINSTYTNPEGSTNTFPIGFSWGYQRVIEDKYVIGFGTQIAAAFNFPPDGFYGVFDEQEIARTVEEAAAAGASSGRVVPFFFTLGYLL